ncbi:hypothetical protein SNEBB_003976, partial [Seison nebaliae]
MQYSTTKIGTNILLDNNGTNFTTVLPENFTRVLPENFTIVLPDNFTRVLLENFTTTTETGTVPIDNAGANSVLSAIDTGTIVLENAQILSEDNARKIIELTTGTVRTIDTDTIYFENPQILSLKDARERIGLIAGALRRLPENQKFAIVEGEMNVDFTDKDTCED